jgi:hypothetical protein
MGESRGRRAPRGGNVVQIEEHDESARAEAE